jgi:hypothetical protein
MINCLGCNKYIKERARAPTTSRYDKIIVCAANIHKKSETQTTNRKKISLRSYFFEFFAVPLFFPDTLFSWKKKEYIWEGNYCE